MDYLIHHMLATSSERFPKKEALVYGKERLTFQDMAMLTGRIGRGLQRLGLQRGDRVGIYLDPSIPQVISFFGISLAGGVFVPINPFLLPEQVVHIINDCEIKFLLTSGEKLKQSPDCLSKCGSLKALIVVGQDGGFSDSRILCIHYDEITKDDLLDLRCSFNIEKDLAAILYTSGSTGKPKGVMISHAQMMAGSSIVSAYLGITNAERILAVLPFSFDAGLNQLMTAVQQGGTLVLMSFLFAKEIVDMLLRESITGLAGVPTLWSLLAQPSSTLHKHKFPHLRYITNTGGAMPQNVLRTLRQALPDTKIYLMYGLTEAFRSTYLPPEELDRRPTSMGKAIPNTEILVVNDNGELCKPGEIGELVHRGPTVSLGYWGQPELTDRVLRPHPLQHSAIGTGEKVCYSGDLVYMDEEGFLYFAGRRDNMIKSSGFRISPTEVEDVLYQSGMVREAGVIGVPDEILGQVVKAYVAPNDGQSLDTEKLRQFCSTKLPRHMIPKFFEVLPSLPKTPTGKVDYPALRKKEGSCEEH